MEIKEKGGGMLEGEISQINLVERLVELWREQFTGAIRFENDGIIKIVYFKGGDILSASTNDRADSIDEILMRAGKVSRDHVKQALARRKENETLGDALLNLGFITRKELAWARRVQVVGVIRSIAAWESGSFTIVADYLPKRDEGTLFPLPQVLVELIVTEQDRARFERALDGGNAVFTKGDDFEGVFRKLGLNEDADAILKEVDGSRNANEIATASGRDSFNVYKLLHALETLGILSRSRKAQGTPEGSVDDFASAGVADAADMWNAEDPVVTPMMVDSGPSFELDEETPAADPTLDIPGFKYESEPAEDLALPPVGSWDEPAPTLAAPPAKDLPAWDVPVREPRVGTPAPIPPPVVAEEEQWGFDEAQIETARRAAVPAPAAPRKAILTPARPAKSSRGRYGLLIALMSLFILAGAGYYGFLWWQGRQSAPLAESVTPARSAPAVPAATATTSDTADSTGTAASTGTIVELPPAGATATTATSATTPAATTTIAAATTAAPAPAAPAPRVITPAPTAPLPAVTPRGAGAGRERYDAMAREYAASASGNFTIQIQILCDPSNLDKVIRDGGANIWFVPQPLGERSCYRVFYGRYATRDEAQRALAQVPAAIRDRSSAVKAVPKG